MRLFMWVEHGLNTGYTIVSSAATFKSFHRRDWAELIPHLTPMKKKKQLRHKNYILHFDV